MAEFLQFPAGFLWGAATSAYQVEGGITNNDWALFEKHGKVKGGQKCGLAANHYNLYEQDFDLLQQLNLNAFRLSLEWSRVEPQREDFSTEAIAHYRAVLESLKRRGITTFVTLHHYTDPIWVRRQGGWLTLKTVRDFGHYTHVVAHELGDLVDYWLTFNEPTLFLMKGYVLGERPPERHSMYFAERAARHILLAHTTAVNSLRHALDKPQVSFAHNIGNAKVHGLLRLIPWVNTLIQFFSSNFPLEVSKRSLTYIALNYYTRVDITFDLWRRSLAMASSGTPPERLTDQGLEIYPKGMYDILLGLKKYRLPIFITENGIADAADTKRAQFIKDHLYYVHKAIQAGCDVRGYLYWSLMDNFEWEEGFRMRYGLAETDYQTYQRVVRPSARVYAEIAKNNQLVY